MLVCFINHSWIVSTGMVGNNVKSLLVKLNLTVHNLTRSRALSCFGLLLRLSRIHHLRISLISMHFPNHIIIWIIIIFTFGWINLILTYSCIFTVVWAFLTEIDVCWLFHMGSGIVNGVLWTIHAIINWVTLYVELDFVSIVAGNQVLPTELGHLLLKSRFADGRILAW